MGCLQITLFGQLRITRSEWRTEVKLTRSLQGVLAYLLVQRHRIQPRETLEGIFWGEHSQEQARSNLNTALWRLRKALDPEGASPGSYLVSTHAGQVGFNPESKYWLDAEIFEEQVSRTLAQPYQDVDETQVRELEDVLKLYQGELLEGFYDDWALRERDHQRQLYLKSLTYLLHYHEFKGFYELGLDYGQKILDLDPLQEEIHREKMKLYMHSGQRASAVRQYEICRSILDKELGIPPMEETEALYSQIRSENHLHNGTIVESERLTCTEMINQLHLAAHQIDLAQEQIQQALKLLTSYQQNQH